MSQHNNSGKFINIKMAVELELIDGEFRLSKNEFPPGAELINRNCGNVLYYLDGHYYINGARSADRHTYKMFVFERCYFIYTRVSHVGRFIDLTTGETLKEFTAELKDMAVHDQILCCNVKNGSDVDFIGSTRGREYTNSHVDTSELYANHIAPITLQSTSPTDVVITSYKGHTGAELPKIVAVDRKYRIAPIVSGDYIFIERIPKNTTVVAGTLFTLKMIPSEVGYVYQIVQCASAAE